MAISTLTVELDRTRILRFDLAGLSLLQRRLGEKGLLPILARIDNMDVEAIQTAYLVGLGGEDPKLTLEKVQRFLQARVDAGELLATLGRTVGRAIAMGAGFSETAPEEDGEGKAATASPT